MSVLESLHLERDWDNPTDRERADVLAKLPLFSRISRRRLRKLAHEVEFEEFAPGEGVVWKGDTGEAFFMIVSGTAEVRGTAGPRLLAPGDYFGEVSVLDGGKRSATVVARDELQLMRLPRRAFLDLVKNDTEVAHAILVDLAQRLRGAAG
jgi:CRP-like cAMP-binding protein